MYLSVDPSLNHSPASQGRGSRVEERQTRVCPCRLWSTVRFPGRLTDPAPSSRTTALLLSVSHLVLVTRNACHLTGGLDWVDQSLSAAEEHLEVLREAAVASETDKGLPGPEGLLQEQSAI